MTKRNQVYRCELCGNITEVLHTGAGELVCCGAPMITFEEKGVEEGNEKHLPVMEKLASDACKGGDGVKVKIGEVSHPMEEAHYIEWVEVKTKDDKVGKKFLNPGDSTEMEFHTRENIVEIRAFCNVHGLWKKTIE